jgi:dUTP pyrophosphatase
MSETITVPTSVEYQAKFPAQARKWDAGYDLSSTEETYIGPGERKLVGTGVAVAIPEGYVGYIKPRSGLAVRHGIDILGGVIDSGYRGEVKAILHNTDPVNGFDVYPGDRIAQLVIQPVVSVDFEDVLTLPDSERGAGGFGSTGVN